MTLAVEPIVNEGTKFCKTLNDGWTVVTKDGKLSAQWEHTIVVLTDGIEILTDRDFWKLRFVIIDNLAIQKIKEFFQWKK